jgi:hypothetical protein
MSKPVGKSIEDHYPLKTIFPPASFTLKDAFTIHHLIVSGSSKTVEWMNKNQGWFEANKKAGVFLWDLSETRTGYSPLHLCAIKGNRIVMAKLIEAGANAKALDTNGWTPADHALVCGNKDILHLLDSHGCLPTSILSRLLGHVVPNPEEIVFDFLDPDDCQVKHGSAELFEKMTGAHFTPCFFATPESLIEDHHIRMSYNGDPKSVALIKYYKEKYLENAPPPKTYLAHSYSDDGHPLGFGVRVQKDVKDGTILFPYVGEQQVKPDFRVSTYVFNKIDGKIYRNFGPNCQDSFPVAVVLSIPCVEGLNQIEILVSGETISRGEEITYTYGYGHYQVKRGRHVELKKQEMEDFFKQKPLPELIEEFSKENKALDLIDWDHPSDGDIQRYLSLTLLKDRLTYIFHTFSSLARLLLKGIVSSVDVEEVLTSPIFSQSIEACPVYHREIDKDVKLMAQFLIKLADLEKENPEEAKEMREFILSLIEMVSVRAYSETLKDLLLIDPVQWLSAKEGLLKEAQIIDEVDQILFSITEENALEFCLGIYTRLSGLAPSKGPGILADCIFSALARGTDLRQVFAHIIQTAGKMDQSPNIDLKEKEK